MRRLLIPVATLLIGTAAGFSASYWLNQHQLKIQQQQRIATCLANYETEKPLFELDTKKVPLPDNLTFSNHVWRQLVYWHGFARTYSLADTTPDPNYVPPQEHFHSTATMNAEDPLLVEIGRFAGGALAIKTAQKAKQGMSFEDLRKWVALHRTDIDNPDANIWGPFDGDIRCQVNPTKTTFHPTDEILLNFTVSNMGTSTVFFMTAHIERFMDLAPIPFDGKPLLRAAAQDWDFKVSRDSFVQIEPGKTWTTQINVSKNWHLDSALKSGKMALFYYNPSIDGHELGINGWTGSLPSNQFDLNIE